MKEYPVIPSSDECREKCIEKQGHFDIITYGCVFTEYLSDVCIRVHVMNNEVGVDVPAYFIIDNNAIILDLSHLFPPSQLAATRLQTITLCTM